MRSALLLPAALTCLVPAVAQPAPQQGRPYDIEDRGRTGGVPGHASITYGRPAAAAGFLYLVTASPAFFSTSFGVA